MSCVACLCVADASAAFGRQWDEVRYASTDVLRIGYHELGRGPAVVLLHGFPYDVHAFSEVAPILAAAGHRAIVPYLRGFGATSYRDDAIMRSAEQAALASDVIDLLDSLRIERAVVAGFDWGARAACAVAALWPQRCAGLVSVGGYLIHDVAHAGRPAHPDDESVLWYQYYLLTARGRAGLARYRRELARKLWREWSPDWIFEDAVFERSAAAFDNPDWVDTVVHNYRYRHGTAPGDPRYADLAGALAELPPIAVPTVSLMGEHAAAQSRHPGGRTERFQGKLQHFVVAGAGHNVPQEQPVAFANAVLAQARNGVA